MLGNGVRVRSFETDVMGSRCAPNGVVCRCVSTADSSLSLSLSLCSQLFSAENGSNTHLLAGRRRVSERGFCAAWRRLLPAAPLACARVANSLGCPPDSPWEASEVVPSRVPSRGGSVGPERRGPVPNPGSRRSPLCVCWVGRGVLMASSARSVVAPGVRGGLAALLVTLDGEPVVRRLLFVKLLAGPRVLARRTRPRTRGGWRLAAKRSCTPAAPRASARHDPHGPTATTEFAPLHHQRKAPK